mmetsp:Transcript_117959/g.263774  ORF Transcript_117959/g.263774 Transcript_117959/m.263774 type:complete len:423 (-) Transcript_117959:579-1847(-)
MAGGGKGRGGGGVRDRGGEAEEPPRARAGVGACANNFPMPPCAALAPQAQATTLWVAAAAVPALAALAGARRACKEGADADGASGVIPTSRVGADAKGNVADEADGDNTPTWILGAPPWLLADATAGDCQLGAAGCGGGNTRTVGGCQLRGAGAAAPAPGGSGSREGTVVPSAEACPAVVPKAEIGRAWTAAALVGEAAPGARTAGLVAAAAGARGGSLCAQQPATPAADAAAAAAKMAAASPPPMVARDRNGCPWLRPCCCKKPMGEGPQGCCGGGPCDDAGATDSAAAGGGAAGCMARTWRCAARFSRIARRRAPCISQHCAWEASVSQRAAAYLVPSSCGASPLLSSPAAVEPPCAARCDTSSSTTASAVAPAISSLAMASLAVRLVLSLRPCRPCNLSSRSLRSLTMQAMTWECNSAV